MDQGKAHACEHSLRSMLSVAIRSSRSLSTFPAAAVVAAVLASCGSNPSPLRGASELPRGVLGRAAPTFRLVDASGGRLGTADLAGRPYLVTFLYTQCRDVCPLIAEEVREAVQRLGPHANEIAALAISVDPRGDTPAAVRRFLVRHHEPANFHYLIGSRAQLQPVWRAYFVGPEPAGAKQSLHTAAVWMVDRHGRWRASFPAGYPLNPADVSFDFKELLRQ